MREYMVLNELMREKMRLGERRRSISQVRNSRNVADPTMLASILMLQPKTYQTILDTIDAHPDWDDETVAEHIDFE